MGNHEKLSDTFVKKLKKVEKKKDPKKDLSRKKSSKVKPTPKASVFKRTVEASPVVLDDKEHQRRAKNLLKVIGKVSSTTKDASVIQKMKKTLKNIAEDRIESESDKLTELVDSKLITDSVDLAMSQVEGTTTSFVTPSPSFVTPSPSPPVRRETREIVAKLDLDTEENTARTVATNHCLDKVQNLKKKYDQLHSENEQLTEWIKKLKLCFEEIKTQQHDLKEKYGEEMEKNEKLAEMYEGLLERYQSLSHERNDLQEQLEAQTEESDKIRTKLARSESNVHDLKEKLSEAYTEVDDLKEKLREKIECALQLLRKYLRLKSQISNMC